MRFLWTASFFLRLKWFKATAAVEAEMVQSYVKWFKATAAVEAEMVQSYGWRLWLRKTLSGFIIPFSADG